jgi:hypothetical protein
MKANTRVRPPSPERNDQLRDFHQRVAKIRQGSSKRERRLQPSVTLHQSPQAVVLGLVLAI